MKRIAALHTIRRHLSFVLNTDLVGVLPVPLVQEVDVVAHADQRLPQHLQLGCVDLRGDRPVSVPSQFCLFQILRYNVYF